MFAMLPPASSGVGGSRGGGAVFAMLPWASSGVGGSWGGGGGGQCLLCCPGLALGWGVLGEGGWGTNLDVACEFPEVIGLIPLAVFAMLPRASSGVVGSRGGGVGY